MNTTILTGELSVFDRESLISLAEEIGLDRAGVTQVLGGDDYANEVRSETRLANQQGVTGVPFFLIDGHHGVSGAQSVDAFAEALDAAWATRRTGPAEASASTRLRKAS